MTPSSCIKSLSASIDSRVDTVYENDVDLIEDSKRMKRTLIRWLRSKRKS